VLISNLVNRATVLLNYPIGDIASMPDVSCSCGRTSKLLSELEGRVEDILTLADGSFVHPRAVWQVFKDDRRVLQYQLVQHELERFELALTTVSETDFEHALALASPTLGELLGPDAVIDANRRSELDPRSGGKFRAVASRCAPAKVGSAGATHPRSCR
jgi:phenylacetate-CoA ligase